MAQRQYHPIEGRLHGQRLSSRALEEQIQAALSQGYRNLHIQAHGQHGIGGRLWRTGSDPVRIKISGHTGQRLGSMGFAHTRIEVLGPASDDVGWLNAGAEIVIQGHAANGTANAMAQGRISVAGSIGARGMTMTKQNPRFAPPELWVLGSVGDYFGEFMAGGICVICGFEAQNPENVLGYRPLVGMVGGRVFLRGPHAGFSHADARLEPMSEADWEWLQANLKGFLERINRSELLGRLAQRESWQLLGARPPQDKAARAARPLADFHSQVWDRELGSGGLIGDLTNLDRSPLPLITSGAMRRFVPVWENRRYAAPCEGSCPSGIPVHERWRLVREGRVDEAVDLALAYTPFPAAVCGYLCPNLCMQACTRHGERMAPVDVRQLGQASIQARAPEMPPESGRKVAVIGGGPAGISVAWQLRRFGHGATVYDTAPLLGGKLESVIPESRIPTAVLARELERVRAVVPHVHLQQPLTREDFSRLREDFDFVVVAVGAQKPRSLPLPGIEHARNALDFLRDAKAGRAKPGARVVVIGAGNVGCDVATEAQRLGAEEITLIDVQKPAAFGAERAAAEAAGARFRWPVRTTAIGPEGVHLEGGELLPADSVVIAIGDQPDLAFLPEAIATERGHVAVNALGQSADPKVFAIGDAVRPGLLTDAIGAGRRAAEAIHAMVEGRRPVGDGRRVLDRRRVTLAYFDPRLEALDLAGCGSHCASCGACRDCGICAAICPGQAIRREPPPGPAAKEGFEYRVDPERCIGCGFCAGACPCGIWDLVENTPLE
jgi:NADPH-dependent glutamate synthase beta subunit-like oxidoreductase/glutamate synthase domain-containing protein 3/NAD-dependent dihydropyrimidine dehydrogenase PreA subunit